MGWTLLVLIKQEIEPDKMCRRQEAHLSSDHPNDPWPPSPTFGGLFPPTPKTLNANERP
jgi:hypothetical protein